MKSLGLKVYQKSIIVEFTDTFAGEANYCWIDRYEIQAKSLRQAITIAKKKRYHSPVPRHKVCYDFGDEIRIDIVGTCVCAFASYKRIKL